MVFAKPGGYGETFYGLAVMPMTAAAGAPNPDGYLYVYGSRSGQYQKRPGGFPREAGADRQLQRLPLLGRQPVGGRHPTRPPSSRVPSRRSSACTRLPDGRFMLVHMTDLLGTSVAVRYGSSPVGPWGKDIIVWDAPEVALTPNVYVYGAKAHPHLSTAGELLISYHANTFDFFENFSAGRADIYRPRFIKVPLP